MTALKMVLGCGNLNITTQQCGKKLITFQQTDMMNWSKKKERCSENKALETNSDKTTSPIMGQISSNFFSFKSIKKGLKCSHFNLLIRSDVTCGVLSVPQQ